MALKSTTTGDSWLDSRPPWSSISAPFQPRTSNHDLAQSLQTHHESTNIAPLGLFSHVLRLNTYLELEHIRFDFRHRSRISIGEGQTFVVEKNLLPSPDVDPDSEPSDKLKWVAVKRAKCVIPKQTGQGVAVVGDTLRRLKAVVLEIEILLHPPLRSHPNIVKLLGFSWDKDTPGYVPLLVMELASFGSLAQLLSSEKVEDEEKRLLCLDAAMGLEVLHSCLIVHGDVKLENVLVFPDERRRFVAKYSDFGLALLGADEPVYRGTRIYNAPEVHRQELGGSAGGNRKEGRIKREDLSKCDVFSFGLLAFEILNGGRRYHDLAETTRFRASLMSREGEYLFHHF
jgi:serine/threonine protein kinase